MKVQTRELIGSALDWAVAKTLGYEPYVRYGYVLVQASKKKLFGLIPKDPVRVRFSTDWAQGGPVIETFKLGVFIGADGQWVGTTSSGDYLERRNGPTPLIAGMRCFVSTHYGYEVEVPDELVVSK